MIELKPCPFCGVSLEPCIEQTLVQVADGVRGLTRSSAPAHKHTNTDCLLSGFVVFDNEESINAWNKRQPLECEAGCPLNFGCKTVVCHRCETEQFVDMEAYVAHLETENERLREGWISAECGARNGWGDCNATCPLKMGEYCEDVRKVVEA